jgi:hypothetical protein
MKSAQVKTTEKISAISRKSEYGGLCMTCEHASTCIYPRDPDRPVWQCEEFEVYEAPLETTTVNGFLAVARAKARPDINENEEVKFKGLCLNCENRKTCIFPKPEEGVWRCEEYE